MAKANWEMAKADWEMAKADWEIEKTDWKIEKADWKIEKADWQMEKADKTEIKESPIYNYNKKLTSARENNYLGIVNHVLHRSARWRMSGINIKTCLQKIQS